MIFEWYWQTKMMEVSTSSTEGLELLQGFTRIADQNQNIIKGMALAFFWPVKDLIHFDLSRKNKSLTKTVPFWVNPCWWIKRFTLQKSSDFFLPPIFLSELLFHWSMDYTANCGDDILPYHTLPPFTRTQTKPLMVCRNSVPNSWSHSWHAGHSSHCGLAGERNMVFERLW